MRMGGNNNTHSVCTASRDKTDNEQMKDREGGGMEFRVARDMSSHRPGCASVLIEEGGEWWKRVSRGGQTRYGRRNGRRHREGKAGRHRG